MTEGGLGSLGTTEGLAEVGDDEPQPASLHSTAGAQTQAD